MHTHIRLNERTFSVCIVEVVVCVWWWWRRWGGGGGKKSHSENHQGALKQPRPFEQVRFLASVQQRDLTSVTYLCG